MHNFIIYVNKKYIPRYAIWAILYLACFVYFFIDVLRFPTVIKYLMDCFNMILLFYIVAFLTKKKASSKNSSIIICIITSFILISLLVAVIRRVDIILLLWGARNTFRFIVFFVGCIIFLDKNNLERIYSKINTVLYINLALCMFEYLILGLSGDYVGGGFGINQGCNALLNGILVIATAYNAALYMKGKISLLLLTINIGMCSSIAGMAELKVYVVEVVIIIIITGFMSKGFLKRVAIVLTAFLFSFVCIRAIELLVPGWEGFFTFDNMYKMISNENGYTGKGDLNRLTSITRLNSVFYGKSINFLGFGLGSCEYSDGFSFLNSSFYMKYNYLHYAWFSIAKIYLELGWLGIIFHIIIWFHVIITVLKKNIVKQIGGVFAISIAIMAIFLFVYNYSMNLDIAYLLYAVLANAYILNKDDNINPKGVRFIYD